MAKKILTLDLHTHLNEKKTDPLAYWLSVIEKKLDGTAITEHANWEPKKAFKELSKTKQGNHILIPGIEVNTNIGHAIVYGKDEQLFEIEELIQKEIEIEDTTKIAKKEGFLVSVPHPFGFNYDSAGYVLGSRKIKKLIKKQKIGVEIYNGMMGHLSDFLFDSGWIRKPYNFFGYLEKNVVARKTGLGRVGKKIRQKMDKKSQSILNRCLMAIELGKDASYVTAGSDAHTPYRIGSGITKIAINEGKEPTVENILKALEKKENIAWVGPYVKEVAPGVFEKMEESLRKKEIALGIKYITKSVVKKKARKN